MLENNSVTYPDYFGEGMDLVYTPTLSGVKEDIVLDSYTGVNSFTFMLNTRGLNLYQANGRYFLAPSKVSDMRIELGDIVSFDARGRFSVGTMTATTIKAGNLYQLTITVDESFLTDENTTYPVSIDPTLTVSDNTHQAGAIEDATLYQGTATLNTGSWPYLHCGYYDSTYKIGRTAINLTGMIDDDEFWSIPYNGVTSAKFYIREAGWTAGVTVNMHEIVGSWDENTITWNSHGNSYYSDVVASASPSYGNYAEFDITEIIQDWRARDDYGNGFMLVSSNETSVDKTLYSSESGSSNRPYIVVTYDAGGSFNKSYLELEEGETDTLTLSGVSGSATWTSSNTNIATVNSSGVVTGIKAGTATITASVTGYTPITCTVYVTIPDGVYFIQNNLLNYYLSSDGSIWDSTPAGLYSEAITDSELIRQMWSIQHLSGEYYVIRPMYNLHMGLYYNSNDVMLKAHGMTDANSSIDFKFKWKIEYNGNGYAIKKNSAALRPAIEDIASGMGVITAFYSADSLNFHWTLTAVSDAPGKLFFYDTKNGGHVTSSTQRKVPKGTSQSLSDLDFLISVCDMSNSSQAVYWSSNNPSVATVNASTGAVTAVSLGTAEISVSRTANGTYFSYKYQLIVVEPTVYVVSYYDSTVADNEEALSYIDDAIAFANRVYGYSFGICFAPAGEPEPFTNTYAGVDACPHGADAPCDSSCHTNCYYHHKNVDNISDRLRNEGKRNYIYVLWSDCEPGIYCMHNANGECVPYADTIGVVVEESNAIQFLTLGEPEGYKELMSIVLAHEFTHTLGYPDVYSDEHDGERGIQCVMEHYSDIFAKGFCESLTGNTRGPKSAFCDGCEADLAELINSKFDLGEE